MSFHISVFDGIAVTVKAFFWQYDVIIDDVISNPDMLSIN